MMAILNKFGAFAYMGGAVSYIIVNSYVDAKIRLDEFRNGTLDHFEKKVVRNELDAVKRGASQSIPESLVFSFVWPLAAILKSVPYVVIKNNK